MFGGVAVVSPIPELIKAQSAASENSRIRLIPKTTEQGIIFDRKGKF